MTIDAPRTPSRGEKTRAKLINAARELLIEGGGEVAFADIASRTGVSAGAPYRHFDSKAALVVAVVEQVFDEFEAATYTPTFEEIEGDWFARERVRIARTVDFFYDEPVFRLVLQGIAGDAHVTQVRTERLQRQTYGAARNIALGQQAGDLPAHIDPLVAGALVMGGIHRLLSTVLNMNPIPERDAVRRDLERFVASVLGIPTHEATHG